MFWLVKLKFVWYTEFMEVYTKALQVSGSCVSGHGDGSEGVYRGLDQHVGYGKNGSLQACGKTDSGNVQEFILVDGQLVEIQAAHAIQSHQAF